jgi:hypothetical protein
LTDGRDNGGVYESSTAGVCAHTENTNPSWFKIDLGSSYEITSITVVGRSNYAEQSNGLTLRIGESGSDADSICKSNINAAGGQRIGIPCETALTGRYITVWHNQFLVLCELEAVSLETSLVEIGVPETPLVERQGTIRNLESGKVARIQVQAVNAQGRGALSPTKVFRTLPGRPPLPQLKHVSKSRTSLEFVCNTSHKNLDGSEQYKLQRSDGDGLFVELGPEVAMQSCSTGTGSHLSAGLEVGTSYEFVNRMLSNQEPPDSPLDSPVYGPLVMGSFPPAPKGFRASTQFSPPQVRIEWDPMANGGVPFRAIVIERDSPNWNKEGGLGETFEVLTTVPHTSQFYVDRNVMAAGTYTYRAFAVSDIGPGPTTPILSVARVASAPSEIAAVERWGFTDNSIFAGWHIPPENGSPILHYSLYMADGLGGPFALVYEGKNNNATIDGLHESEPYQFYVTATNAVGTSVPSLLSHLRVGGIPPVVADPILVWAGCHVAGWPNYCAEHSKNADAQACVFLRWDMLQNNTACEVKQYRILRDGVDVGVVPYDSNEFLDVFVTWHSHLDLSVNCFESATVSSVPKHQKYTYTIQVENCAGWGLSSNGLAVPMAAPPRQVCSRWIKVGTGANGRYECTAPGLAVEVLSATSLRYQWIYIQDAEADFPQSEPDPYLTTVPFLTQLLGSTDHNVILGYELLLDDGKGGPFQVVFDGRGKPMTNETEIHELTPGLMYRAFVRAVSWVGLGDASDVVYAIMALPPPAPVNVTAEFYEGKKVLVKWKMPEGLGTASDDPQILKFIVERAVEPAYSLWIKAQVEPDNTDFSLVVTNIEKEQRYLFRVRAVNAVGEGANSEHIFRLVGDKPYVAPRNVFRVDSNESSITLQWDRADMGDLGVESLMFSNDWGYRGYCWDPAVDIAPKLAYDGLGRPRPERFTATGLKCGTRYLLAVSIVSIVGEGPMSSPIDVTLSVPSGPPVSLYASFTNATHIILKWSPPDFTGCTRLHQYRILRDDNDGNGFKVVGYSEEATPTTPAKAEYVDTGTCWPLAGNCICPPSCLVAGKRYIYRVQARTEYLDDKQGIVLFAGPLGYGSGSNIAIAYAGQAPGPPLDVRFLNSTSTDLWLTWQPPLDFVTGNTTVLTYVVQRDNGWGEEWTQALVTGNTNITLSGLHPQVRYRVRVAAQNIVGQGAYAQELVFMSAAIPGSPENVLVLSSKSSNSFSAEPKSASTPTPEGFALRFGTTQQTGFGWAMLVAPVNSSASADEVRSGIGALGGIDCRKTKVPITSGDTLWKFGGTADSSGCLLVYGSQYYALVYIEGEKGAGTLSGPVPITVPPGTSNFFLTGSCVDEPHDRNGNHGEFHSSIIRPGMGNHCTDGCSCRDDWLGSPGRTSCIRW